ncbi:hypothetical protein AB4259_11790 [Vibrio amylolyticus]|uniref:hypothetical protein n=1 Tax=Vibrio amylolyticus TaxID=2847292 RepID=UPI00354BD42C
MSQANLLTTLRKVGVLLCGALSLSVFARGGVDVLAIEFPPYTTASMQDQGIAFDKLRSHPAMSEIDINPQFSPPTRLGKRLLMGDWCLSFYPPRDKNNPTLKKWVLSNEDIPLGFYRLNQQSAFQWDDLSELEGLSVALLVSYSKKGLSGVLHDSGLDVLEVNSLAQGFDLLLKSRVDLVFADRYSGEFIAVEHEYRLEDLEFSTSSIAIEQFHVWVNLQCTDLVKEISPYWN